LECHEIPLPQVSIRERKKGAREVAYEFGIGKKRGEGKRNQVAKASIEGKERKFLRLCAKLKKWSPATFHNLTRAPREKKGLQFFGNVGRWVQNAKIKTILASIAKGGGKKKKKRRIKRGERSTPVRR